MAYTAGFFERGLTDFFGRKMCQVAMAAKSMTMAIYRGQANLKEKDGP
jgi:hypothetical protein